MRLIGFVVYVLFANIEEWFRIFLHLLLHIPLLRLHGATNRFNRKMDAPFMGYAGTEGEET